MSGRCALCGASLAGEAAPAACTRCPMGSHCGAEAVCCPRCGFTSVAPDGSLFVRAFDWIHSKVSKKGTPS